MRADYRPRAGQKVALLGIAQIIHALDGITYPAQRWEILSGAEYNGATLALRSALGRLPARRYTDVQHVAATLNTLGNHA